MDQNDWSMDHTWSYKETSGNHETWTFNFQPLSTGITGSPQIGLRLDIWASQELLPLRHVNITSSLCQRCHGKEKNTYPCGILWSYVKPRYTCPCLSLGCRMFCQVCCTCLVRCLCALSLLLTLSTMKCVLPIGWDRHHNNTQFAIALFWILILSSISSYDPFSYVISNLWEQMAGNQENSTFLWQTITFKKSKWWTVLTCNNNMS